MESKILVEEAHRLGGGADQVQDLPVQDTGGVQGGCAEHCAQRGDLPRGAQHDGGHRQADVQGLRQRPARDDHMQGLLQICQHKGGQALVCQALPALPRHCLRQAERLSLLASQGGGVPGEQ